MAIPVTVPPLSPGKGKTIYWKREELVVMDDILCQYLYVGENIRTDIAPETQALITGMIDKINRHI